MSIIVNNKRTVYSAIWALPLFTVYFILNCMTKIFSARDKNERKLYGFAFARLMEASGATLRDGAHELYVYKCDDPAK